jgi:hypothetical protein
MIIDVINQAQLQNCHRKRKLFAPVVSIAGLTKDACYTRLNKIWQLKYSIKTEYVYDDVCTNQLLY